MDEIYVSGETKINKAYENDDQQRWCTPCLGIVGLLHMVQRQCLMVEMYQVRYTILNHANDSANVQFLVILQMTSH